MKNQPFFQNVAKCKTSYSPFSQCPNWPSLPLYHPGETQNNSCAIVWGWRGGRGTMENVEVAKEQKNKNKLFISLWEKGRGNWEWPVYRQPFIFIDMNTITITIPSYHRYEYQMNNLHYIYCKYKFALKPGRFWLSLLREERNFKTSGKRWW